MNFRKNNPYNETLVFSQVIEKDAEIPLRAHPTDAGIDLRSDVEVILGRTPVRIPTNLRVVIPDGHYGQIMPRSGLALRGVHCHPGVIDSGYRGQIMVILSALADQYPIDKGEKICQLLILPVPQFTMEFISVGAFDAKYLNTDRGTKGFGSTGK